MNSDTESDAEKRAYHNLLERKRRDHIKDSFSSLRDVLPAFNKGEKVKASRAQILKKAVDFIQNTTRKNDAYSVDIKDLKKENVLLEEQIRILQKAVATGNLDDIPEFTIPTSACPSTSISLSASSEASASSSESDSEDLDDEESSDCRSSEDELPKRKRRKAGP